MADKKILLTGVSGTGKSAMCRELAKLGFNTIGIDEIEGLSYWVHKITKEKLSKKANFTANFLTTYEWVCDMGALSKLVAEIDGTVVICGNVENITEVIDFCDKSLALVCSPETFISRIKARDDNEYGQGTDAQTFLLSYYEHDNQTCINAGAIAIDAERPIETVVQDIIEQIQYYEL